MKKIFILLTTLLSISALSQTVILRNSHKREVHVMRFDKVSNNTLQLSICMDSNYNDCRVVGEADARELQDYIDSEKSKRNKSGLASAGMLALTGVGLYFGLVHDNMAAFFVGMASSMCQVIPFSFFMKGLDPYMMRSQTEELLEEVNTCSLDERKVVDVVNYEQLKNHLKKFFE